MALCHSGHRGLRAFPARLVFGIVLGAGSLGGCSDSATRVSPPGEHACAGGDAITLAVLASVTLDCSAGTSLQLPGNGATYLVVPQFAVGNVSSASTRYTLAATGTALFGILTLWLKQRKGRRVEIERPGLKVKAPSAHELQKALSALHDYDELTLTLNRGKLLKRARKKKGAPRTPRNLR